MKKRFRNYFIIFMALVVSFAFTLQNNYAEDNAIAQINGGQVEQTVNQGGESYAKPNVEQTPKPLETQKSLGNTTEIEEQKTAETMNEEGINSKPNNLDGSDSNSDSNNEIKNEESKINSTEEEKNKDKEVNVLTDHKKEEENKNTATPINVKLSKTEVNKMGELSGAKLKFFKVEDGKETEVKNWESGNSPLELSLEPGTYKMVEEEAPKGYKASEPVEFTVKEDNSVNIDSVFKAYTNQIIKSSIDRYDLIYVYPKGDSNNKTVVYCFNAKKQLPPEEDSVINKKLEYFAEYGTGKLFEEKASREVLKGEDLKEAVLKAIYNGYPHNKVGLQEKYGLSDNEFRRATQQAIWYFTDSGGVVNNRYEGSLNEKRAYEILIGKGLDIDESLKKAPSNMTLYLYTPYENKSKSEYYQNLLSTRFIDPVTVILENTKLQDQTNPKPEEPKDSEKEKPEEPKDSIVLIEKPRNSGNNRRISRGGNNNSNENNVEEKEEHKIRESGVVKIKEEQPDKNEETKKEENKEDKKDKKENEGENLVRYNGDKHSTENKNSNGSSENKVKYIKSNKNTLPVTGDGLSLDIYLYAAIALGGIMIFLGRKNEKSENKK